MIIDCTKIKKKILIEILFHILNIYYKKIHIFSMHREFK